MAFSSGELKILKLDLNLAKVPGLSTLRITCAAPVEEGNHYTQGRGLLPPFFQPKTILNPT